MSAFAGVNTLFFGDFWQLNPAGGRSFMSNPCDVTGDPCVDFTMNMFWFNPKQDYDLQPWHGGKRVLELTTNIRSGEDKWFSEVLDEMRLGKLSIDNYNFLHGLTTFTPISFWHLRETHQKDGTNKKTVLLRSHVLIAKKNERGETDA
eukprot:6777046-Karenia_brevis.AAC.1